MRIAKHQQSMNSYTVFSKIDHLDCNLISHSKTRKSPESFTKLAQLAYDYGDIDPRIFNFGIKEDEISKLFSIAATGKDYKNLTLVSIRIALYEIGLGFRLWQCGDTIHYINIPFAKTTGTIIFGHQNDKPFVEEYSLTWQNGTLLRMTREYGCLNHTYHIFPYEPHTDRQSSRSHRHRFITTEYIDIFRTRGGCLDENNP